MKKAGARCAGFSCLPNEFVSDSARVRGGLDLRRRMLCGDLGLHRSLHLFEGADLDLTDPLARDAKLGRQIFQRHRVISQTTRFEAAAIAH